MLTFRAVVGGLTGILVGLAASTLPGIGMAIAAGPIVAGLTGDIAGAVTPVKLAVEEGPPLDDEVTANALPMMELVPITQSTTSVIPDPDLITSGPVLPVIEEPQVGEGDTDADFQRIESVTNYPKG